MEVFVLFLAFVLAHFALTAVQFRFGLLFLILTYGIYPKLFSVGISEQGFVLCGQRAMLYVLLGFYVMKALWGSAEIRHGIDVLSRGAFPRFTSRPVDANFYGADGGIRAGPYPEAGHARAPDRRYPATRPRYDASPAAGSTAR